MAAGFQAMALEAFKGLAERGLAPQDLQEEPLAVCQAFRGRGAVVTVCLEMGSQVAVYLARATQDQGPWSMDEVHNMEELVRLRRGEPGVEALRASMQACASPAEVLALLAATLLELAGGALEGAEEDFAALARVRVSRKHAFKDRFLTHNNFPPEAWGLRGRQVQ